MDNKTLTPTTENPTTEKPTTENPTTEQNKTTENPTRLETQKPSLPALPSNSPLEINPPKKKGRPKGGHNKPKEIMTVKPTLAKQVTLSTGSVPALQASSEEKKVDDETAVVLVGLLWSTLDMFTGRLGMEPLTYQEQEKLSKATIPVLEKYGVPMGAASPEIVLAATALQVYAPKWHTRKKPIKKIIDTVKIEPTGETMRVKTNPDDWKIDKGVS